MKNKKNRNRWHRVIAGAVGFCLLLSVIPIVPVQAASATITLETKSEEIQVGDIVEVQLILRADVAIGDFETSLKYDATIFEFSSAPSCIIGSDGIVKISDIGASPSQQDRVYRIYFEAIDAGECEIALHERPIVYSYADGTELSVTGFSKTFTVVPSSTVSSDSTLSALYIEDNLQQPVVLTPAFSSDIKTYAATVEYVSESLTVNAISTDSNASIEVLGEKELALGVNEVTIKVIAEDSSEMVYTILIRRLEETEKVTETEPSEITLQAGISVQVKDENIWLTQYHDYIVCEKPEDFVVPDKYTETILMIDGIQITAYVNEEITEEEFLLLILQNEAGEIGWYRYDRIEQTLQRVCEEEYIVTQVVQQNDEALQEALLQYEMQQKGLIVAIAVLFGVMLSLLMVILWLCIRCRNRG